MKLPKKYHPFFAAIVGVGIKDICTTLDDGKYAIRDVLQYLQCKNHTSQIVNCPKGQWYVPGAANCSNASKKGIKRRVYTYLLFLHVIIILCYFDLPYVLLHMNQLFFVDFMHTHCDITFSYYQTTFVKTVLKEIGGIHGIVTNSSLVTTQEQLYETVPQHSIMILS